MPAAGCSRPRRGRGVRVVFASSSSIYGDAESYPTAEDAVPQPIAPYGVTKLCVEHLAYAHARTTGLDAVCVRYFTVYGPRQRPDMAFTPLLEALASGEPYRLFGDGSVSRSFTFVADAVAGTIAAMERGAGGETYNIGGGEEATMRDAIALAEAIAGRELARRAPRGRGGGREAHARGCEQGGGGARLGADDVARGRSPGPVGLGRR